MMEKMQEDGVQAVWKCGGLEVWASPWLSVIDDSHSSRVCVCVCVCGAGKKLARLGRNSG